MVEEKVIGTLSIDNETADDDDDSQPRETGPAGKTKFKQCSSPNRRRRFLSEEVVVDEVWTTFWQHYACPEGSRVKISLPVGVVPFRRRCLRSLLSQDIVLLYRTVLSLRQSWILDSMPCIPDSISWILDSLSEDLGYRIRDSRFRLRKGQRE